MVEKNNIQVIRFKYLEKYKISQQKNNYNEILVIINKFLTVLSN